MSDYDRSKFHSKKKFHPARDTSSGFGRSFFSKTDGVSPKSTNETTPKKQPTILIKTREPTNDEATSSSKRNHKEDISTNISVSISRESDAIPAHTFKHMTKSTKLIDEGIICTESLQDYVQDNSEFLVVGVIGPHGVGKSTIMNLLIHNQITEEIKLNLFKSNKTNNENNDCDGENIRLLTDNLDRINLRSNEGAKKEVFKIQTPEDIENACNKTQGIDIFITSNRLILLDCQPFSSISVLEDLIKYENKRTNLVSEFIPLENSGEIQGLQLTTFLMSVCHVLLVVQDWFFDSNIVRFIQSAEMLKPTIPNPEEEVTDHFPHLLLIHNRAQMTDFSPAKFKTMQSVYKMLFHKTKLNIKSGLGLGTGRLINYLNTENCGSPINLFLIPDVELHTNIIYNGHPPLEELIKKLRTNILGATRNPLTHVQLTEKTWLIYCSKVWDTVKKSSFFVEYMKLMP